MASANNNLGYVSVEGAEGQFRGASLVVDQRGIPMDFRYTDPIRPSRLERILYGSALDVYLREELILQSLLGAVETTPSLWVCSEGDLLAPLKAAGKGRAIFLRGSARVRPRPMEPTGEAEVLLIQADSVSAPLRASFSPGTRPDEIKQVVSLLVEAARTMELLEPFGRIEKALLSLKEE